MESYVETDASGRKKAFNVCDEPCAIEKGMRLIGETVDISFVSPHVVAGHNNIDAALPDGVTREEIELDETLP